MSKIIHCLLLTAIITLHAGMVVSQNIIQEGSLSYQVSITSLAGGKAAGSARYSVYWKGRLSRTEMKSTMGSEFSIYDGRIEKGSIFKEYSGQKLMIPLNGDQWKDKHQARQQLAFMLHGETKEIAGRLCRKATAGSEGGRTFTVWYDPAVLPFNQDYDFAFKNIPGLPVNISMRSGQYEYDYLLERFTEEPIPNSLFEVSGKGYRSISFEELNKMRGE